LNTLDELDRLDKEIKTAKRDKERALGTRNTLTSQMDKSFGVKSLEGAKRKLAKLDEERVQTNKLLDEKFQNLTENYAW